jgi:hypothetical protein
MDIGGLCFETLFRDFSSSIPLFDELVLFQPASILASVFVLKDNNILNNTRHDMSGSNMNVPI